MSKPFSHTTRLSCVPGTQRRNNFHAIYLTIHNLPFDQWCSVITLLLFVLLLLRALWDLSSFRSTLFFSSLCHSLFTHPCTAETSRCNFVAINNLSLASWKCGQVDHIGAASNHHGFLCVTLNCFTINHNSRMCKMRILMELLFLLNNCQAVIQS
jgi:hypothetical protein